jgi:nitrile hydratase accessory protein
MNQASPLLARALPASVDGERVFAEPWEARAFAIVVELLRAGHFSWSEWVECFSVQVAAANAAEAHGQPANSYYQQWLDAAESLLAAKGLASREQLAAKRLAIGAANAVGTAHAR